jgi:WhiB family redox-sensing transcriptional regulator
MGRNAPAFETSTAEVVDWRDLAACLEAPAEMFFPLPTDHETIELAKRWCAICPVRDECLAWAMDRREPFGVWGGTTEAERTSTVRQAARRRREAAGG